MWACRYHDNLAGESCRSRAICEAVREERPDGWGSYPRIALIEIVLDRPAWHVARNVMLAYLCLPMALLA